MRHPNVVATAIGYYRIRRGDSWPQDKHQHKGTGARTLLNSEVRPYSWPAVLVFVADWIAANQFSKGGDYESEEMVPKTLYLPDGRVVPVCVIEAPRDPKGAAQPESIRYPLNNIGTGHPVIVRGQHYEHVATVACLVSDGHKTYALTNRHVAGDVGEVICSQLGGRDERIGASTPLQARRVAFSELHPDWSGKGTFVNMDAGLIEIDDLNRWTAKLPDGSTPGPMFDVSTAGFPLSLIGRRVRGYGSASHWMEGEIHALFYRHKARGGSEYVSDFFIGPRTSTKQKRKRPKSTNKKRNHSKSTDKHRQFATRRGDSGTLWLLDPQHDAAHKTRHRKNHHANDNPSDPTTELRPLALQWGASVLYSGSTSQSYALATALSTICERLDVDFVRDLNLEQDETWGAVGHFSIASRVAGALSRRVPKLKELMINNARIVSHDDDTILNSNFKGMSEDEFIPMADVPDFFWKHGKQGHTRGVEGPNHFADMDQKRPVDGLDLLTLCKNPKNVDPDVWNTFYNSINDLETGGAITQKHRGLLPFRVWQIFDSMIEFVEKNKIPEFVCAAGVLTHYVGDACQPLHISYLHDGDPTRGTDKTVTHRDGTQETKHVSLGEGLHSAYEDDMVNANRDKILADLNKTAQVRKDELVKTGYEAALKTITLMRSTFSKLPPQDLLDTYLGIGKNEKPADVLWRQFGRKTISAMQSGTHLLAVLWESAWLAGEGEKRRRRTSAISQNEAMVICARRTFLPSHAINQIGRLLKKRVTTQGGQVATPRRRANGRAQPQPAAAAPAH